MKKFRIGLVIILSLASFLPALAPELRAQAEPFYKGKTIRIVVGSTAGGFMTDGPASLPDIWSSIFPDSRR